MHASSMENMRRCLDWYRPRGELAVVDLGAADVNGSYRSLFCDGDNVLGVDLEPGVGVDLVLDSPYELPIESGSRDLVISGQMLEHSAHFWRVFEEIERILKPGGLSFVIAPSSGPIHRYPVDCYRFYPDAYQAAADWANLRLVHCWMDDRGPWNDLVGVFQKGGDLVPVSAPPVHAALSTNYPSSSVDGAENSRGSRPSLEVIAECLEICEPEFFVEIGAENDDLLRLARSSAAIGSVEPSNAPRSVSVFNMASDDFFFFFGGENAFARAVDMAYLGQPKRVEEVLRDFMNIERCMNPGGVVIVPGVLPCHPLQASRERATQVWAADVWQLVHVLGRHRKDLELTLLDTAPTGLLLIQSLDPSSSTLHNRYNYVTRNHLSASEPVPSRVLSRHAAASPASADLRRILS